MPEYALTALAAVGSGINLQSLLISVLVLTISLSFHEFAHGYVAYRLGDDSAALAGRLTLNPLAHLDPIGSLMFIFFRFGYAKPVPINPARFTRARSMKFGIMLSSLAGPMANLLIAIIAMFLLYSIDTVAYLAHVSARNPVLEILTGDQGVLFSFYVSNILLMLFNLIPIPPLDGSKVFSYILPNQLYYRYLGLQRFTPLLFILLYFSRGFLGRAMQAVLVPFDRIIMAPMNFLFMAIWRLLGII